MPIGKCKMQNEILPALSSAFSSFVLMQFSFDSRNNISLVLEMNPHLLLSLR